MSAISDYLENALMNHLFKGSAYTAPSTIYVALFTAAPSDSGGGTEVSGGSYARVACTTSTWASPSNGVTSNSSAISFPTSTGSWGTVTHFGLYDAASSGNLLWHGQLSNSVTIGSGATPIRFSAGTLQISIA